MIKLTDQELEQWASALDSWATEADGNNDELTDCCRREASAFRELFAFRAASATSAVETSELERIRAALPKTADGVSVVPGMRLWHQAFMENGERQGPYPHICPVSNRMVWMGNSGEVYGSGPDDVSELFSTKEAADAVVKHSIGGEL